MSDRLLREGDVLLALEALIVNRPDDHVANYFDGGVQTCIRTIQDLAAALPSTPVSEEREEAREWLSSLLSWYDDGYPPNENSLTFERIRTWLSRQAKRKVAYDKANPLGGPARMFYAMAERIEAGEPYDEVLADYDVRVGTPQPEVGREFLGKIVRMVWMEWAREQPNPKPSWLQPWEELTEPEREVDRRIGERIYNMAIGCMHAAPQQQAEPRCEGWKHMSAEDRADFDAATYCDAYEGHESAEACPPGCCATAPAQRAICGLEFTEAHKRETAAPQQQAEPIERGPWRVHQEGDVLERHADVIDIASDDFTHDVLLRVSGDFENTDQKRAYAEMIAAKLNAAPPPDSEAVALLRDIERCTDSQPLRRRISAYLARKEPKG